MNDVSNERLKYSSMQLFPRIPMDRFWQKAFPKKVFQKYCFVENLLRSLLRTLNLLKCWFKQIHSKILQIIVFLLVFTYTFQEQMTFSMPKEPKRLSLAFLLFYTSRTGIYFQNTQQEIHTGKEKYRFLQQTKLVTKYEFCSLKLTA